MVSEWLNQFSQHRQIKQLDIHLANFLIQKAEFKDTVMAQHFGLLVLSLSIEVRMGHVCLDLTSPIVLAMPNNDYAISAPPSLSHFKQAIEYARSKHVVGDGQHALSPLVFSNNMLYFYRMWQDETTVARYFTNNAALSANIGSVLEQLFPCPSEETDWQKIAVAMALTHKISIISGGPGTGKTTTVAKILAGIKMMNIETRIISAAPTGKAASRLTESLSRAIVDLSLKNLDVKAEALTLHRLLGAQADSRSFLYNKKNLLHIDVLVIDEASMVGLSMMARVIDALPNHARLILLGDKEQLSSVEAGAVFGDLCEFIKLGYSAARAEQLSMLTGYSLLSTQSKPTIADSICLLKKSYRFNDTSGIGLLAKSIQDGDVMNAKKYLVESPFPDVAFHPLNMASDYYDLLIHSVKQYQKYLLMIKDHHSIDINAILKQFSQYRLLSAVREGGLGVRKLNREIERLLAKQQLISLNNNELWYIGRPIIILKNRASLGLYNGDIGITLTSPADPKQLRVYFIFPDGSIHGFSPSRLPDHETAYVMTVHKSQGSEFNDVGVVLPNEYSPLLNRALLYTAVTRAKRTVTIYANESVLVQAIHTQTERNSGLVQRLL